MNKLIFSVLCVLASTTALAQEVKQAEVIQLDGAPKVLVTKKPARVEIERQMVEEKVETKKELVLFHELDLVERLLGQERLFVKPYLGEMVFFNKSVSRLNSNTAVKPETIKGMNPKKADGSSGGH